MPERVVLSAVRHVHEAVARLGGLLGRMSQAGPGLVGLDGCPHATYLCAVSSDSDGSVEIVRPMAELATAREAASRLGRVSQVHGLLRAARHAL